MSKVNKLRAPILPCKIGDSCDRMEFTDIFGTVHKQVNDLVVESVTLVLTKYIRSWWRVKATTINGRQSFTGAVEWFNFNK